MAVAEVSEGSMYDTDNSVRAIPLQQDRDVGGLTLAV